MTVPSVRGTLDHAPLARLLGDALARRSTGTLELRAPDGTTALLVFDHGSLANIRVPTPPMFLGAVAYELGMLDLERLNASLMDLARTKRPHGTLLVAQGVLTEEQRDTALVEQARRKIHALFSWSGTTTFAFHPDFDGLVGWGGGGRPRVDLRPSIWYGVREFPPTKEIEATMGSGGRASFVLARGADLGCLGLAPDELVVSECLGVRSLTLEELARLAALGVRKTELLLYFLLLVGAAERREAEVAPPVSRPAPRTSGFVPTTTPRPSAAPDPSAAAKLSARAYVAMRAGDMELAESLCAKADEADSQEVDHTSLRIWMGALRPAGQTPEATQRAIVALSRIIALHDSAHAHFFRGQLYKRAGRLAEASRDFHAVIELDPERADAMAELRLYAARRQRA
jgi:tetratricopeptide (TPR) repeat protein